MNKEEAYDIAYGLFEEKRYSEAIPLLKELTSKCPDFSDAISLYTNCLVEIGHFTDAARVLMKIKRKTAETEYNLGFTLLCMGKVSDGLECCKKALELSPPKKVRKMAERMLRQRQAFEQKIENNYPISLEDEFKYEL